MFNRKSAIALAFSCLLLAGCPGDDQPPPASPRRGAGVGAAAPGGGGGGGGRMVGGGADLFRLSNFEGQPVTVKTPAALFFFTSWCGYCKQAMPQIKQLAERARQRGWAVYGVNVREGQSQVAPFIRDYQPNFPILMDTQGLVANQYKVRGYPTFVVIDQNANVIYNDHAVPSNL